MRILVTSDLHIEHQPDDGDAVINKLNRDADVLVVAGDMATKSLFSFTVKRLCDLYEWVVFVSGNHEYYGSCFDKIDNMISVAESRHSNFVWLNDSTKTINSVRFIGSTLWFKEPETLQEIGAKRILNDYYVIRDFVPEVYDRHEKTVAYLDKNIKQGDIVVTHHMPTYRSVPDKFVGSISNCFFANHLDRLFSHKPSVWIHGHTHSSCDYIHPVESVRVYCNPLGYPREETNFNNNLIIEVGDEI